MLLSVCLSKLGKIRGIPQKPERFPSCHAFQFFLYTFRRRMRGIQYLFAQRLVAAASSVEAAYLAFDLGFYFKRFAYLSKYSPLPLRKR